MIGALIAAYEVERLLFRIALVALVGKLLSEAWGAWRARRSPAALDPPAWPLVTVQIPIRNELHVVERVLRAAARLDYPAFEIQVLDDSDDATREVADRVAADLRARGCAIEVIHGAATATVRRPARSRSASRVRGASTSRSSTPISSRSPSSCARPSRTSSPIRASAWCRGAGRTSIATPRSSRAPRRWSSTG